jgi:hypothetical protein
MTSPFFRSLRGRWLLVVQGLTALPALLIGGRAYQNARQTVETRVNAQLTSVADLKKDQITAWLDDRAPTPACSLTTFTLEATFHHLQNRIGTSDPQVMSSCTRRRSKNA